MADSCCSVADYFDVQVREVFKVKDIEKEKCRNKAIG
jgi:hypothetical protein